MRKLKKGFEDLIEVINGDLENIKSIKYFTTDEENFITPHIAEGEQCCHPVLICHICQEDLAKLENGQLKRIIEMEQGDLRFCDGHYNEIQQKGLNIFLYGE